MNVVRLDADRQRLDYRNFIDDEEVTLLHHKRDMDVPDNIFAYEPDRVLI